MAQSFETYGQFTGLRYTVVYGGVGQGPQVRALQNGVDILVATPGRLLDLMEQGHVDLRNVEILILDEADQMLDMGFIVPLRKIVAAVPQEAANADVLGHDAARDSQAGQRVAHRSGARSSGPGRHAGRAGRAVGVLRRAAATSRNCSRTFLQNTAFTRTLVFARTKHGADKIVKHLDRAGIRAAAIHGNKSQNVRQRTLDAFKSNRPPVLVATDIAARGLDVDDISHVINYELPEVAEIYVHRIGRTGRAGATGIATSFCGRDERDQLRQIERLTRRTINVEQDHPQYVRTAADHDAGEERLVATTQPSRATANARPTAARRNRAGPSGNSRLPRPALAAAHPRKRTRRRRQPGGRRHAL